VPARGKAPGEVRIIGGQWKRSKLSVLERPGLRPTPDRVRETLFNWLGQDLSGWRCFDAFAGSGALAFEAASRGAKEVIACEIDPALVAQLWVSKDKLKADAVLVQRANGLNAMRAQAPASWDLVFLDPPFDGDLLAPSLQAAAQVLKPGGRVYVEAAQPWTEAQLQPLGWQCQRHLRAGAVHAHLLSRLSNGTSG
jgi:16S rRNA (guanine966-N2)-methyltransferase